MNRKKCKFSRRFRFLRKIRNSTRIIKMNIKRIIKEILTAILRGILKGVAIQEIIKGINKRITQNRGFRMIIKNRDFYKKI